MSTSIHDDMEDMKGKNVIIKKEKHIQHVSIDSYLIILCYLHSISKTTLKLICIEHFHNIFLILVTFMETTRHYYI